jgi:hypothetical protein
MKETHVRIVKDMDECRKLWNKFSPKRTLWDLWDVAFPFYVEAINTPHFMVIQDGSGTDVGLVPLCYDTEVEGYRYFGLGLAENRTFWFDDSLFPFVLKEMPAKTVIHDIGKNAAENITKRYHETTGVFFHEDYRYFLNLVKLNHNHEEHLKTFSGKHRKNFMNDMKKLKELPLKISWEKTEHFDNFVRFSKERFGKESDLMDDSYVLSMKSFFMFLEKEGMLSTCTVVMDGKIQGVQFGALHNKIYYILLGGFNPDIKNLGKLIILEHIKKAAELKAREVDFLSTDTGWKQLWNLEKEPYYALRK